jgi:hypothetical protein
VWKIIEEARDVGIENNAIAAVMVFENLLHRLVAVTSLAEAEGRVMKQPLEDGVEQASQDFLSHSVANGGDTQRAELSRLFRNEFPTEWKRREGAILQLPLQSLEVLDEIGLEHAEADLVDARRAAVAFDGLEGVPQQRLGNPPSEGVCFLFGFWKHSHVDFS